MCVREISRTEASILVCTHCEWENKTNVHQSHCFITMVYLQWFRCTPSTLILIKMLVKIPSVCWRNLKCEHDHRNTTGNNTDWQNKPFQFTSSWCTSMWLDLQKICTDSKNAAPANWQTLTSKHKQFRVGYLLWIVHVNPSNQQDDQDDWQNYCQSDVLTQDLMGGLQRLGHWEITTF